MVEEIWKDVPSYKGIYQASNLGRIKSLERIVFNKRKFFFIKKEKILKGYLNKKGYLTVSLINNKVRVIHSIIAETFLNHKPNSKMDFVIDHINNIKTDNRCENLQVITNRENCSKDVKNTSSKFIGVSWDRERKKWQSYIKINKVKKFLGRFDNEIDASNAYQDALKSYNNGDLS